MRWYKRCRRMRTTVTHRSTHPQEVAFVLLDLVADVLIEEQLAEDEGAHGLHIQTLRLRQDLLISSVDGSTLFLMLEMENVFTFHCQPISILEDGASKTQILGIESH